MDISAQKICDGSGGGNCVIITTLMPSRTRLQTPRQPFHFSCSEARTDSSPNLQRQKRQKRLKQSNYFNLADEKGDNLALNCVTRPIYGLTSTDTGCLDAHETADGSTGLLTRGLLRSGVTASTGAKVGFPVVSVKKTAGLGPLIVVKRTQDSGAAALRRYFTSLSGIEVLSYTRKIDELRGQLDKVNDMLAESKRSSEQERFEMQRQFEEHRREEAQHFQQEFEKIFADLMAEKEELVDRLRRLKEETGVATFLEREKIENEWNNRLIENENKWRELLQSSEHRWEECMEKQVQQKHEAMRQVRELAQTVEELEVTLRRVTREKDWAVQERDALLSSQRQSSAAVRSDFDAEILKLRQALREREDREAVLLARLEACGKENGEKETDLKRQLQQTRQELEDERRGAAELVKLYSTQVEWLHRQLNDAMERNKHLTRELEKVKG